MGETSNKILNIINNAQPNANLVAKAQKIYDVSAQLAKEQQFYSAITNPFTGEPIRSIQDLNRLIKQFDTDINYNFSALLPAGAVEQRLSEKYNLSLNVRNKFSEVEQSRVRERLNTLANEALQIMVSNMDDFGQKLDQYVLNMLIYAMGGLNISNGEMTIFTNDKRIDRINADVYDIFNIDRMPKGINVVNIAANILGKGNVKQRAGTTITRDLNNIPIQIDINPDFNAFSPKAFEDLYKWAEAQKDLLEPRAETSNKMGSGTLSPMDVSPQEFEQDVFRAVSSLLGGKYSGILTTTASGEFHELYQKYDVGNQIALGRQLSNVRGFLGELRAILIIDAMFPRGGGHLMGTAKVQLANATKGGESAPIDLLVDLLNEVGIQIGFQVKNTSELSAYSWGNRRSKNGMAIPTFYVERLQELLTEEERNFFGAYVYNQPVPEEDKNDWYANHVYSKFEPKFNEFYQVYKKLALYIIRQETEISSSNNPLLSGKLSNDFFIMNDKIVPASSFFQAMNNGNEDLISSTFNINTNSTGFYDPAAPMPHSYSGYATQALVSYEISVKYAALLQSAYNMS